MRQTHTLPAAPWPQLTNQAIALISDAQFAQAGAWHLQHLRLDLPMPLAIAPSAAHHSLRVWLSKQNVRYTFTGAHRPDVALHFEFSK